MNIFRQAVNPGLFWMCFSSASLCGHMFFEEAEYGDAGYGIVKIMVSFFFVDSFQLLLPRNSSTAVAVAEPGTSLI